MHFFQTGSIDYSLEGASKGACAMPRVLARLLSGQEVELSLEEPSLVTLRRHLEQALRVPARLQRLPRGRKRVENGWKMTKNG